MKRNTCYRLENGFQHIHKDQDVWMTGRYLRYFIRTHWITYQADSRHKTVKDYPDIKWKEGNRLDFQWELLKQDLRNFFGVGVFNEEIRRAYQRGAIAFDATTGESNSATSPLNITHTCTGSNRYLFASCEHTGTSDTITGVTYNSVSMTRQLKLNWASDTEAAYMYYLLAPATGANTVAQSFTGSATHYMCSSSYTGVSQSGFPDSSNSGIANLASSLTVSTTVVASNCWLTESAHTTAWSGTPGGAGTTVRVTGATTGIADSNSTVGTGSQSQTINASNGSQYLAMILVSVAPAAAAAAITPNTMLLMNVG